MRIYRVFFELTERRLHVRDINNLFKFSEMTMLFQYLYLSEDNYIDIKNSTGVTLRLRMNDNMVILCQNMNFPDLPPSNWSEKMTINTVFFIIDQLKEAPAIKCPKRCENRWEEIESICKPHMSLRCKV